MRAIFILAVAAVAGSTAFDAAAQTRMGSAGPRGFGRPGSAQRMVRPPGFIGSGRVYAQGTASVRTYSSAAASAQASSRAYFRGYGDVQLGRGRFRTAPAYGGWVSQQRYRGYVGRGSYGYADAGIGYRRPGGYTGYTGYSSSYGDYPAYGSAYGYEGGYSDAERYVGGGYGGYAYPPAYAYPPVYPCGCRY